jgi:acetyl-CoA carboxylase carboxyl transferase subunit beta|uniref:AccD n=1 Tax=Prototheca lentecrescens TaxID=2836214 RepID=UPI0030012972
MSIFSWIEEKQKEKKAKRKAEAIKSLTANQVIDEYTLWTRCENCGVILYIKHLHHNNKVCIGCNFHLLMNSFERIEGFLDTDSWNPINETLSAGDPIKFADQKTYTERLLESQQATGLQDAIQTGTGMIDGVPLAIGIMDFFFMGGSMGSVVGEKITRLVEYATLKGLSLIIFCASGGARMQEGILSLMQMAKIAASLNRHQSLAKLLYIPFLTSPTTGGVTASFAMLGDLIFAEPRALIGFAGRRVIEQTLQEELPKDFQTAEYLLQHGLVDLIISRIFLKQALAEMVIFFQEAPGKELGVLDFVGRRQLTKVEEEIIRRSIKKDQPSFMSMFKSFFSFFTGKKEESKNFFPFMEALKNSMNPVKFESIKYLVLNSTNKQLLNA